MNHVWRYRFSHAFPVPNLQFALSADHVVQIDLMVKQGKFSSRADALRTALEAFLDAEQRRLIGEAIADGYRRIPQTEDELAGAEASARAMIAEEPW